MEATTYLRFIASLVLVLGLMVAVLWALRRFNIGGMVARPGARRRLAVVETMAVDSRRRLLLVRRDGVEHLVLIGGPQDLVVERGIVPSVDVGAADMGPADSGKEKGE
ncbi:MAG TPA: flagellar biosynthetic protein FliO [Magnetospirillum sp.]|nr:flagellar biosynthetic protein FliO [Magnetospirillum sp.]